MKRLAGIILGCFIALACYGALRPILITGTTASATLFKGAIPVSIGLAGLIAIIMGIAYFGSKLKR